MIGMFKRLWNTYFSDSPDPVFEKLKGFKKRDELNKIEELLYNEVANENSDTGQADSEKGA